MSFISYAQNYEDVMLWRALKHIENGFYIDVGANDPEHDSVTKLFYDNGWRGINIEPVPQWFDRLEEYRPRDINLQIAAGNTVGKMPLYDLPDTGLSTMDLATAERHEEERGYKKAEFEVQVETLTNICKKYHEKPIHFLKIDVEGAEKAVLDGLDLIQIRPWLIVLDGFDLIQIRPWLIVIESTLPNTQIEDHELWESQILEAEYEFVYFDGLNRFYIANEHKELTNSFKAPPNVFDEFITQQQLKSEMRAQTAEENSAQLESDLSQSEAAKAKLADEVRTIKEELNATHQSNHHWYTAANELDEELKAVYASKSWRIMLFVRKIMHLMIRLTHQSKQLAKTFTISAMRFVIKQPRLKETALAILFKFPRFKDYLNKMALNTGLSTKETHYSSALQENVIEQEIATAQELNFALSPGALRIYTELKHAIELRDKQCV